MSIQHENYQLLSKLIANITNIPEYSKSKVSGYMDLNMDRLSLSGDTTTIALSHYYKHPSGDMIPDPDMTMKIDNKNQAVEALTYQDIYFFEDVYASGNRDDMVAKKLNIFLSTWLNNLIEQGHSLK